jgi:hypothetical protein
VIGLRSIALAYFAVVSSPLSSAVQESHFAKNPDRQSWRNCLPGHAHGEEDGDRHGGGLFRCRRARAACADGGRGGLYRPAASPRSPICSRTRSSRPASRPARMRSTPAMASCRSARASARRWTRRASSSSARRPNAIAAMGDKIESKKLAKEAGVNVVPGYVGEIDDTEHAVKIANDIGYPVMIKASAGGGGKGMRLAYQREGRARGLRGDQARGLATASATTACSSRSSSSKAAPYRDPGAGRQHGNVVYLNERECSIQRRHQKVVEEAPSPFRDAQDAQGDGRAGVALAKAVGYFSAGTVELIVSRGHDRRGLLFPRDEHPPAGRASGHRAHHRLDLVEQMIRVANGEKLALSQADVKHQRLGDRNRVYAEDPYRGFLPSTGRLMRYAPAGGGRRARRRPASAEGGEISMFYDPMIAKLDAPRSDRQADRGARQLRDRGAGPQHRFRLGDHAA